MDALDVPASNRHALLSERCGDDLDLRSEVESLLTQAVQDEFLEPLAPLDRDPLIGTTVAGYRVLRLLGEGGMGVVYLAEDERLERRAALKFLRPELVLDESAKARFIREARAGAALDHPNICPLYGIEETPDGGLFIALRYYDGETLKQRLARETLPLETSLDIALQIANGLKAAHDAGIVHRDVKPGNVLLTNGPIKILDFGIAKVRDRAPLTTHGSALGTLNYMSPEQESGSSVDHRTDVWSLGVVLREMVSGAGTDTDVFAVIARATATAPRDRYQSMGDFAAALSALRQGFNQGRGAPAGRQSRDRVCVVVRRDGHVVSSAHFNKTELVVGRAPESDVVLDDPKVSWAHGRITLDRVGALSFVDQSSNGSFHAGQRIDIASLGRGGVVSIKPFDVELSVVTAPQRHPVTVHVAEDAGRKPDRLARLRVVKGPGALIDQVFPLAARVNAVGRAEDCDVRLDFPSISRRHATIAPAGGGDWILEDTGSRNGVRADGAPVRTARLKYGDHLGFGSEIVAVLEPADIEPRAIRAERFSCTFAASRLDSRVSIARVAGILDEETSPALHEQFTAAMGAGRRFLIVDLSQCSSCEQAGFSVFIGIDVTLRRRGGTLYLVSLREDAKALYRSLGLERVLSVQADEAAAVSAVSPLLGRQ